MKSLPKFVMSYKPLFDMLNGRIKSEMLMTALKLKVFDYLAEYSGVEEIAGKLSSHPENTGRFLDTLCMIGLVEKKDGMYRNREQAVLFLSSNSPQYIGDLFMLVERMSIEPLDQLESLVVDGPVPAGKAGDIGDENLWAAAARSSAAWVYGEAGRTIASAIAGIPGADSFRRMLDLGGGHGLFTLYMAEALPGLSGVIYDRAPIVAVADEFICEYGFEDRVSVRAGDYVTDDIGSGYDLIWASATLNFAKGRLGSLFEKILGALNPGGYFISFQDGLTHEKTQPETMLGHSIDILRIGGDFSFEQGEIAEQMIKSGFKSVRSRTIELPMGAMDMDIARKSE